MKEKQNCAACGAPNAYRLNVNGTLYNCCEGSPACEEKITASWSGKNIAATKYEAEKKEKEAPWWEKAFTGFTTRKAPLPDFTVGEEVDLLNPPLWAPGSSRVIITNMKLHEDGRIQCSWIDKKGGCGGAPSDSFRKVNSMPENKACPCLHTTPCDPRCTCVDSVSSVGCRRCCTYGSPEQQKSKAQFLVKLFDKSRIDLANEVLKAQEARKDEDIDIWAKRLAEDAVAGEPTAPVNYLHGYYDGWTEALENKSSSTGLGIGKASDRFALSSKACDQLVSWAKAAGMPLADMEAAVSEIYDALEAAEAEIIRIKTKQEMKVINDLLEEANRKMNND